jgi:hypothetical protein
VVEPYVEAAFLEGLPAVRAEGTPLSQDLTAAETTVAAAERELAAYLAAVSAEDVGAEAFRGGARQRREAVEQAQTDLDQAREQAGVADLPQAAELRATWPDLTMPERRELLRAGLDRIVLGKGKVAIEKRARIVWRGEGGDDA